MILVKVNMMARTATANHLTRVTIIESLEMYSCHEIIHLPNNPNLHYSVLEKPASYMEMLQPLIDGLLKNGIESDRCIVFCRSYEEMITSFQNMVLGLYDRNCLFAFNKRGLEGIFVTNLMVVRQKIRTKAKIVADFTKPDGFIRIIFATVAFGMGLDYPNIRRIIHWGSPQILNFMCKKQAMLAVTNRKHMQFSITKRSICPAIHKIL